MQTDFTGNTSLYQNVGNPILDINNNDDKIVRNRLQSSGFLEIKPLKFLTFRSSIGGDLNFTNENIYNVKFDNDQTTFILPGGNQRNPNSNLTARFDNSFHWVFDNIVTFEKTIQKKYNQMVSRNYGRRVFFQKPFRL